MELGSKIRSLRLRAGMTQEMLAEELGVSFQTISKWENGVCAPDIMMLPKLSVYFGVTIDELFDLTIDQKLHRIENMLDLESELPHSTFVETIDYLQDLLEKDYNNGRINSFFAHVYHYRMASDSVKAAKYAKRAMMLRPEIKDCYWILQKAEGAAICDWNSKQHNRTIYYYDLSFVLDEENGAKPLYTDALEAMAMIYEIQENYAEAIKCYDRILKVLADAFGYTEGAPVDEVNEEKHRVMMLMNQQEQ